MRENSLVAGLIETGLVDDADGEFGPQGLT